MRIPRRRVSRRRVSRRKVSHRREIVQQLESIHDLSQQLNWEIQEWERLTV